MFRMPAFYVQPVKPLPETAAPVPPQPKLDIAKAIVLSKHMAKTAGTLYLAKKAVDTASEIALIAARAKFR